MEHGQIRIKVEQVSKSFGHSEVLHQINLHIPASQIFGLLGPSGSGKTTLVKIISGIDEASSGEVFVLDHKMPVLSMLGKIGYMSQSDALYQELTAYENLDFFASLYGIRSKQRKNRIKEVMELVNLSEDLHKQVSNYSGGMKRRLSLAAALLHDPKILILDEPTVGIDPLLRQSIWQEFSRLSKDGTTILVTTHVMDEAEKCDQLGMIRNGSLIAVGTPEQLKAETDSSTLEEAFLHYGRETL